MDKEAGRAFYEKKSINMKSLALEEWDRGGGGVGRQGY
jgi:hypothetical protein